MLDIVGGILFAISTFLLIGLAISLALAYALYRLVASMDAKQRALIVAGLIILGILLIGSVVGAEFGVISLLTGVFTQVFATLYPQSSEPEA